MRYIAFLAPEAQGAVYAVLAEYGAIIDPIPDARQLLAVITSSDDDCLVVDPSLINPTMAEAIAVALTEFPRPVVAFSSITTTAMDSAVILAQRTQARFIFRGIQDERSALERALLLTPDVKLLAALLSRVDAQMARLPSLVRARVMETFQTGEGPRSLDALAAATALTRRSIDRHVGDAGFGSVKRLLDAARIVSGYRAITRSRVPLDSIARMLGYTIRTMDAQCTLLLGVSSRGLRAEFLPVDEVAGRIARRLTEREG